MSSSISLCMIAKNEEANLAQCLAGVRDLVQETVIVDTGSTDRTKEVARELGARVFDFPWVDDFSAARNESLRLASGRWIFWLDGDDRIDEQNRERLGRVFAGLADDNAAYVMRCLCPALDRPGLVAFDHVRLFPNDPAIRWRYRVHEQILPALEERGARFHWTDIEIVHTGYQDDEIQSRKHERNLRLLHMQNEAHPEDPYTLFYLAWTYQNTNRLQEALEYYRQTLARARPGVSYVRKTYTMATRILRQLGRPGEALSVCREGLALFPHDVELLFQHAWLLYLHGDRAGAEACLLSLLRPAPPEHVFNMGVDPGLRGYITRNNLAVIYRDQQRFAEAEAQWRAILVEQPRFTDALLGLGELYLTQGRWPEMGDILRKLEEDPKTALQAVVLKAQLLLAQRDFAGARELLGPAIEREPRALGPRIVLSRVLWQEGRDRAAVEQALRDVLAIDPNHPEARAQLAALGRS